MVYSVRLWLAGGKEKGGIANTDSVVVFQAGWLGNEHTVYVGAVGASLVVDDKGIVDGRETGMMARNLLVGHDNGVTFFAT